MNIVKILKKIAYFGLFFLSLLVFLSFFTTPARAQTPTPDPCVDPRETTTEGDDVNITPALECIDETIPSINITFHDLSPDPQKYVICTGSKLCLLKDQAFPKDFLPDNSIKRNDIKNDNGEVSFTACGDGKDKIKLGSDCKDGRDYFWGGNIYIFSIGIEKGDNYIATKTSNFYVSRYYPDVKIDPNVGLNSSTKEVTVTLSGKSRPGGEKRNNYQITMAGAEGYNHEGCTSLGVDSDGQRFTGPFGVGKYDIKVNERINEPKSTGGILKTIGIDSVFSAISPIGYLKTAYDVYKDGGKLRNSCQGGFTYYDIKCEFTNQFGGGSCSEPQLTKDPKGEEAKAFAKDLAELAKLGVVSKIPCGNGSTNSYTNPGGCHAINSAIGPIRVDSPQGFIETIFRFILMLAAFGGTIIIIYTGYIFMTSRGDKEKIAGARETLTSAIVGLLFIILSIVILEVIGVDILKIPGFTR